MVSFAFEIIYQLAHSHSCAPIIMLIHEVHHLQISLAFAFLALVVGCASGCPKQFALAGSARIPVMLSVLADSLFRWRYQCLSGKGIPNCLYPHLQKSTSISNSSIFLWRASRSLSKSAVSDFAPNAALAFSTSSFFHLEIISGEISYFFAKITLCLRFFKSLQGNLGLELWDELPSCCLSHFAVKL